MCKGEPAPDVTWWQEQRLIDRYSESRAEEGVRNVLKLERLGRPDLRTTISCQASNTQMSLPLIKSVIIDLNRESQETIHYYFIRIINNGDYYAVAAATVLHGQTIYEDDCVEYCCFIAIYLDRLTFFLLALSNILFPALAPYVVRFEEAVL